jgi:hypothetical protein
VLTSTTVAAGQHRCQRPTQSDTHGSPGWGQGPCRHRPASVNAAVSTQRLRSNTGGRFSGNKTSLLQLYIAMCYVFAASESGALSLCTIAPTAHRGAGQQASMQPSALSGFAATQVGCIWTELPSLLQPAGAVYYVFAASGLGALLLCTMAPTAQGAQGSRLSCSRLRPAAFHQRR